MAIGGSGGQPPRRVALRPAPPPSRLLSCRRSPQEPAWKPQAYAPEEEVQKDAAWLEGKTAEELEELEDETGDDRFMEEYRWGHSAFFFV